MVSFAQVSSISACCSLSSSFWFDGAKLRLGVGRELMFGPGPEGTCDAMGGRAAVLAGCAAPPKPEGGADPTPDAKETLAGWFDPIGA